MKYQHRNTKIAEVMNLYSCTEAEAGVRLDMYETGRRHGVEEGRAEAQRFFRVVLGVEAPALEERAYWNLPVPFARELAEEPAEAV